MKKITIVTAVILALILPALLGACQGGGSEDPTGAAEQASSSVPETASAGMPSTENLAPAENELLEAFRADGNELRKSPVRSYMPFAGEDSEFYFYDYAKFDRTLAGTYAVKFSDIDGDGGDELLAFGLALRDEPYRIYGSETDLPLYLLSVTVYDKTENGDIVSDTVNTDFTSGAIFDLEGSIRCFAAEKDGAIALLYTFSYDSSLYRYKLLSCRDGGLKEVFARNFHYSPPEPGEDGTPVVSGEPDDAEAAAGDEWFRGDAGSDTVVSAIADIRGAIGAAGLEPLMFPLRSDGEPLSDDELSGQSDFCFGTAKDEEKEQLYLFIEDMTRSYENIPAALKTGGTRIFTAAQWELALTHDSAGLHAEYDEDDAAVRFYVSEHSKNHFVAISPLRDTEDGAVRIVDNDDADNAWTVRYTADAGGRETYEYTSVPDAGALFGAAPSGFSAVDRFDGGGTDFYLTYDVSDPAFGGKSAGQILDEYVEAAEENGFDLITDMPNNNGGRTRSLSAGQTEFTVSYYDEPDTGVTLTVQFTLKSIQ